MGLQRGVSTVEIGKTQALHRWEIALIATIRGLQLVHVSFSDPGVKEIGSACLENGNWLCGIIKHKNSLFNLLFTH